MVTWLIHKYLLDCALGWQNFIKDLRNRKPLNSREGFSIDTLNQKLKMFRAHFYESGRNSFVDFKDKKYYNLFVLKYGGK